MAAQQTLHMVGGVGETSYANNSLMQREGIFEAKPVLEEGIKRLYGANIPSCLRLADLGCSSGPNALVVASNIIGIVDAISHSLNCDPPTLQYFLNDLFENDFNSIFKALPDFHKRLEQEKWPRSASPCFFNATIGTFYGRLYPCNSIHFFHSSFALHFLSQAPKGLTKEGEPLNKGNIYITNTSPPAVYKAYLEQFQDDFRVFLKSRSEELVPRGGMVLIFIGRDENENMITFWELLGLTINEMVSENMVEEAKLDSFNYPVYAPTEEEVKQIIEAEGSFTLQRLNMIKHGWEAGLTHHDDEAAYSSGSAALDNEDDIRGEYIAKYVRAGTEPILKPSFGEGIMDELFFRFEKKVAKLLMERKLDFALLAMFMTKN